MSRKFNDFTVTVDKKEINCRIYEPTLTDQKEANKVRNEAFNDALLSNAPLRSQLSLMLKNRGAWDDEREKQFNETTKKIDDAEKRLAEGSFPLIKARELALEMRAWRADRRELLGEMSKLDNNTAEGQADNMAFNYLVSAGLVYIEEGKETKYFENLEDYLNRSTEDVAYQAASNLASLLYDVSIDMDKQLPENQFLLDFDFIDEKLRLVNAGGHLVDADNRLINTDGQYIDADGKVVDKNGNLLTEDGYFDVEYKGFLDDDGNVVMGKSHQKSPDEDTEGVE